MSLHNPHISHRGVDFDDDDFPFYEEDKSHIKVSL